MMEFLYFPEDKSLYIPAIISLLIFVIGAFVTMYFIQKASKKEQEKWDEQYKNHKD
ncbi:hypothetical protein JCM21714_3132 [Gracilibacillus boraciitolerans JCM 21714]|uniref:Uncharacterized protein n=1 Tax=Gracilibacillus boraciitolerans JCM 21714 TaxID=1298598 RepID=W4VLC4_9BACI|nr:hypothetical protein [Gracilibacillus boraciitolerans]GAE94007.1 hypothetical protein JCM21714_3132 [Gracilibacillus boraciitolerans JCM 21714]